MPRELNILYYFQRRLQRSSRAIDFLYYSNVDIVRIKSIYEKRLFVLKSINR